MAYCRLEDTFVDDPKWDSVADMSGLCRATVAGHVAFLYSWCLRHAPDGHLGHVTKSTIQRVIGARDVSLIDALVTENVLEVTTEGFKVHGYGRRAESYNRSKQKANERLTKTSRATVARLSHDMSHDSRENVARLSHDMSHDSRENVAHREERIGEETKGKEKQNELPLGPGVVMIAKPIVKPTAKHVAKPKPCLAEHPVVVEHRRLMLAVHDTRLGLQTPAELGAARALQEAWGEQWPSVLEFYVNLPASDWFGQRGWTLSLAKSQHSGLFVRWKAAGGGSPRETTSQRIAREERERKEKLTLKLAEIEELAQAQEMAS